MPIFLAKVFRKLTVMQTAELSVEAKTEAAARRKARLQAPYSAQWKDDPSTEPEAGAIYVEEIEILADGDEDTSENHDL